MITYYINIMNKVENNALTCMQHMNIYDKNNNILACIIKWKFKPLKSTFLSDKEMNFQYGVSYYKKNDEIQKHYHNKIKRTIEGTSEVVMIRDGNVIADIYDRENELVMSYTLTSNDIIILIDGGHGFKMLDDAWIFNLKQGPYNEEIDKTYF